MDEIGSSIEEAVPKAIVAGRKELERLRPRLDLVARLHFGDELELQALRTELQEMQSDLGGLTDPILAEEFGWLARHFGRDAIDGTWTYGTSSRRGKGGPTSALMDARYKEITVAGMTNLVAATFVLQVVDRNLRTAAVAEREIAAASSLVEQVVTTVSSLEAARRQTIERLLTTRRDWQLQRETDLAAERESTMKAAEHRVRLWESGLAAAAVVLVAPGLIAAVYGANAVNHSSAEGMGAMMALVSFAGLLAVWIAFQAGTTGPPPPGRVVEPECTALVVLFATGLFGIVVASVWVEQLWESISIGVLSLVLLLLVIGRMEMLRGPSAVPDASADGGGTTDAENRH